MSVNNIEFLKQEKEKMIEYLLLKVKKQDWHGVADAAMDIREIEAKLQVLEDKNANS